MPIRNLNEFRQKYIQFKDAANTLTQQDFIDLRDFISTNPSVRDDINIERDSANITRLAENVALPQRPQVPVGPVGPTVAPPPPQKVPTIFGEMEIPGGQQIPGLSQLLPREEAIPISEVAGKEQASLEEARQRFLQEQAAEKALIQEESIKQQQALESARQRFLQEEEAAFPKVVEQARAIFQPGIEKSLKRTRDIFGARGLGTGGFEGSGALQELAKQGAQELEQQASAQAFQNLLGARQKASLLGLEAAQTPSIFGKEALGRQLGAQEQFRGLGLEAAQVPSIFRRSGLERGLSQRDISSERAFEKMLAELTGQSQIGAARQQRRGSQIGDILGFAGSILGGPIGGGIARSIFG